MTPRKRRIQGTVKFCRAPLYAIVEAEQREFYLLLAKMGVRFVPRGTRITFAPGTGPDGRPRCWAPQVVQ